MVEVNYIYKEKGKWKAKRELINKYRIRDRKVRLNALHDIKDIGWYRRFRRSFGLREFKVLSIKEY